MSKYVKCALKEDAPTYTQYMQRKPKIGEKKKNKKTFSLLNAQPIYKIYQIH